MPEPPGKISVIQPSFGAGELSPALSGRVDLAKYRSGARTVRNFFTLPTGGAATRPGTMFVGRCKGSGNLNNDLVYPPKLIEFVFKQTQAYVLEFGHLYMRVVMNPGQPGSPGYVLEPAKVLVGVTQANPAVFNVVAHGLATGDQVFVASALGMTAINSTAGFQLRVTITDANHFTATDLDGNPVNAAAYPAYTASSGSVARVFTLVTPYANTDVALLKTTQSADVMTICHPSYAPQKLTRTQHWAWTLTAITFQAAVQAPATIGGTGGAATLDYWYVVTAVVDTPFEESVPTAPFLITNVALNQTTGVNNSVTWTAPASGPAPNRYNVYRSQAITHLLTQPTIFGYIGQSTGLSFIDNNFAPDFSNTPPAHINPFAAGNNPSCTTYYQGRQIYAGSNTSPNTLWTSKSGAFFNMDISSPARDDDAITENLTSSQVNAIKNMVANNNALLCFTGNGAWVVNAGSNSDVLTPTSILSRPQAYNGASDIRPLPINYDVLYVDAKQSRVRDLEFNLYAAIYEGDDKSILAEHLFAGRTILSWAYATEPYKIIWAARDDGVLLGFTYMKKQEVYAWHRHDTAGQFTQVASIPEGSEDAVYFVVQRLVPGVNGGFWVNYVERFASRNMGGNRALGVPSNVERAWCVDCGLAYGAQFVAGASLLPGAGATTGGTAGVQFATSSAVFTASMVGSVIRGCGGAATITGYTSPTLVIGTVLPWAPFTAVPNDPARNALPAEAGYWQLSAPVSTVTGLDHLNGCTVAILADGNVQPQQVVASGSITLTSPASLVAVGLPYQCQLQTLNLDLGEPTVQGKRKRIAEVTMILEDARGLKVGPVKLNGDTANLPQLVEVKERTAGLDFGEPIHLLTGYERVIPMPLWQREGVLMIQQDAPLPATVLALVPNVIVGDT